MKDKLLMLSAVAILLAVTIPQFLFDSNDTLWNVFYERQAMNAFENNRLSQTDELSYLGRANSFVPGYFTAKALFLKLFGLSFDDYSKIIFGFLMNIILLISMIYFAKKNNIVNKHIFILAFVSCTFIFVLLAANLMHVLSLSLLFFSLGLLKDNKKYSGVVFGLSCIVHAFSFILFPIMAFYRLEKKKSLIKAYAIGIVIFLAFYGPTLLNLGVPNELYPEDFGYLTNWGLNAIPGEFFLLTPLLIASVFYSFYRKDYSTSIMIALFSLLYAFLSFRVIIILAFYFAISLSNMSREKKSLYVFIILLILLNFSVLAYRIGGLPCVDGYISKECTSAIEYVSLYTSSNSSLAVDPILGHATEYYANRKVLADLYVEYADYNKLKAEIDYENTGDSNLLDIYGIGYTITKNKCEEQLYDNGYYRFCIL